MFNNPFIDQYRFYYSKTGDNEDDVIDNDIDDGIIPYVSMFRHVYRSSFVVSHDWTLS